MKPKKLLAEISLVGYWDDREFYAVEIETAGDGRFYVDYYSEADRGGWFPLEDENRNVVEKIRSRLIKSILENDREAVVKAWAGVQSIVEVIFFITNFDECHNNKKKGGNHGQ